MRCCLSISSRLHHITFDGITPCNLKLTMVGIFINITEKLVNIPSQGLSSVALASASSRGLCTILRIYYSFKIFI